MAPNADVLTHTGLRGLAEVNQLPRGRGGLAHGTRPSEKLGHTGRAGLNQPRRHQVWGNRRLFEPRRLRGVVTARGLQSGGEEAGMLLGQQV